MDHVDGNALAGAFADIFRRDLSGATARCAGCGTIAPLARALAFVTAMGAVLRCRDCDAVHAVLVDSGGRRLLSMPGVTGLDVAPA